VTELPRRLETVAKDTFIDDLHTMAPAITGGETPPRTKERQ